MSERKRPKNIARKLRVIRGHLGVSQTGMKELLNFNSPYGRITEYERGKRQPTILTLLAYSRVARVPLEQIVDDDLELIF
jgi:transcriptional regulator with XRE-family HTH domain